MPTPEGFSNSPGCVESYAATAKFRLYTKAEGQVKDRPMILREEVEFKASLQFALLIFTALPVVNHKDIFSVLCVDAVPIVKQRASPVVHGVTYFQYPEPSSPPPPPPPLPLQW